MKALLLIGGMATRLFPLSKQIAKSLLPVVDREVLHYQITQLALAGVNEIILAAGHLVEQLETYTRDYSGGLKFHISVEREPLGTAGAIANAAELIGDDPVIVLNADIISTLEIKQLIEAHKRGGRPATITGYEVEDPSRYGLLDIEGNAIRGFIEKPDPQITAPPYLINAGAYLLEPEAVRSIPYGKKVSIERETFPKLIESHGALTVCPFEGLWMDIGTFESYFNANFSLLARRYAQGEDWLWGEREDSAIFKDLVYINNQVTLGNKVDLFHKVILMQGVNVGDNVRLQNCLVLPGANIGSNTDVRNAIVGPGTGVKPDAILKNMVLIEGHEPIPFYPEAQEM